MKTDDDDDNDDSVCIQHPELIHGSNFKLDNGKFWLKTNWFDLISFSLSLSLTHSSFSIVLTFINSILLWFLFFCLFVPFINGLVWFSYWIQLDSSCFERQKKKYHHHHYRKAIYTQKGSKKSKKRYDSGLILSKKKSYLFLIFSF